MANLIDITPVKTYKTKENAIKAVDKLYSGHFGSGLRYFIHIHTDGRFFPVFVGEKALQLGVHFHFNIIA